MRNLKRALSLTLASVMLLGMMVVGAGAAGFPDVDDDNDNIEAIEVLQAVEVMIGDDNGNFGPNDPVNRSQMAVVMAKLLNLDYQYYEASCPFWDVPTWARPYVGACYANKIVSGYGDGTYGAADGVTPVQAASMMMRALGYFQYSEDYKDGFETATVRQGTEIGIFEGIGSSATANMTRAQVARMALNALESEMVSFTGTPGTTYTTSTGESLSIGYVPKYTPRTSTEIKYQAIEDRTSDVAGNDNVNRGQYYIQLGEELYNGKLTKKFDRDEFMRPSINWQYDGKEIGVYVDYDLKKAEYKEEVKCSDLYNLLTYTTINDNDLGVYVDGGERTDVVKNDFSRSSTKKLGGQGVLTEVFVDQFRDEITITSINTYLAQANSDYNKNTETLSLKVFDDSSATGVLSTTKTVDVEDVSGIEGVKKDEFALVYMSIKDRTQYEVVNMFEVEIMNESTVTKFSTHGDAGDAHRKVVDKLTTGGSEYKTNVKAYYNFNKALEEYNNQLLTDMTYNIFLDRYDNVIGVELAEGTKNYVFITGYDRNGSHIAINTADAAAIFLDGTMDVISVNVTDTNKNIDRADGLKDDSDNDKYFKFWNTGTGNTTENRWYTYTVNANGVYTLKPVVNMFATDYVNYKVDDTFNGRHDQTLNSANLFVEDNGTVDWDSDNIAAERIDGTRGRAYGEDASIYITVGHGEVDLDDGSSKQAITEVKGVYSGIQDVKLEISGDNADAANNFESAGPQGHVPNSVYTMYDDDRYIIASIVVGEAQGATANYAYILSGVKSEEYVSGSSSRASDDGYYLWEFEAFYQGEKTTLKAKTKYPSDSYDLDRYTIRELRFDGDYVNNVVEVDHSKMHVSNTTNEKIEDMAVYDVGRDDHSGWDDGDPFVHSSTATGEITNGNGSDTVGCTEGRLDGTIYLQGRTLYVNEAGRTDVGLAFARDAAALLVQRENGSVETRVYGSVDEAVRNIADKYPNTPGTQFRGRIAAVLDSRGVAQWVVIISDTNLVNGNNPNYDYNGRTYTLSLRDSLSNDIYSLGGFRTYVYVRENSSRQWTPLAPSNNNAYYGDIYEIKSGYQVRILDRDITSGDQFDGQLMSNGSALVFNTVEGEITFTMPNSNVEMWENVAYSYTVKQFDVDLGQPIKLGELDKTKISITPMASRDTLARAAETLYPVTNGEITITKAVGEIDLVEKKLVAKVEWTWTPAANSVNDYEVESTVDVVVTDNAGNEQTNENVTVTSGSVAAEADTTVLAGPVVAVLDSEGFTVEDLEKAASDGLIVVEANGNAADYAVVDDSATVEIKTEGETTTASISVDLSKSEVVSEGDEIAINGVDVTVPADGKVETEEVPVTPDEPVVPTEKYTVTFAAGEGATGTMAAVEVEKAAEGDTTYALPECTFTAPAGKHFAGWLVGADATPKAAGTEIVLTGDVTVTASWVENDANTFTINKSAATGGSYTVKVEGDEVEVAAAEAKVTVTATPDQGYELSAITVKDADNGNVTVTMDENVGTFTMPAEAVTVTVTFVKGEEPAGEKYTVTFDAGEGAAGTMEAVEVEKAAVGDTTYTLPACTFTAPAGKKFAGWLVGSDTTPKAAGSSITLTGNITVTASWEEDDTPADKKYTVTFAAGEGAAGTMGAVEVSVVADGETKYTLPACTFTAPAGKKFAGWLVGNDTTPRAAETEITLTGDVTVTASWEEDDTPAGEKYTVTFAAGEDATGTMETVEVSVVADGDTKYTLPACAFTAPAGKKFAGWLVGSDTTPKAAETEITLTGDITVTASWESEPIEVIVLGANGSETEIKGELAENGSCTLTDSEGATLVAGAKYVVVGGDYKTALTVVADTNPATKLEVTGMTDAAETVYLAPAVEVAGLNTGFGSAKITYGESVADVDLKGNEASYAATYYIPVDATIALESAGANAGQVIKVTTDENESTAGNLESGSEAATDNAQATGSYIVKGTDVKLTFTVGDAD